MQPVRPPGADHSIHYHFDTTASQEVCPKVAGYVFANFMRPKGN